MTRAAGWLLAALLMAGFVGTYIYLDGLVGGLLVIGAALAVAALIILAIVLIDS